jgi:UDPglucose 6-dehydrogenase
LIEDLLSAGAEVRAYDPVAKPDIRKIHLAKSAQDALEGCDALAIVTEWAEFRSPDFGALKKALKTPVIFDGRNLYDPATMKGHGFEYFAIGRKT